MEKIIIDGLEFEAYRIATEHAAVLLIKGTKGLLGCGYFSIETAAKLNDALALVTGVKTFDDMLAASVKAVSPAAAIYGVEPGMTGRHALVLMEDILNPAENLNSLHGFRSHSSIIPSDDASIALRDNQKIQSETQCK